MYKKKRAAKTIPRQYELFVEELENNAAFRDANLTNIADMKWKTLAAKLNACGGPQRAVAAWKRVLVDWKSNTKRKDNILKTRSRGEGVCKDKLSDLEIRLLRIMSARKNLIQPTAPEQLQHSIVIENSDRIEFVNEEGAIISNTDKLEFTCNETPTLACKQEKCRPLNRECDKFLDTSQNSEIGLSHKEEMLAELKGIRSVLEKQLQELHVQNGINKLRARIEYEKAKAKYLNFNLEIQF